MPLQTTQVDKEPLRWLFTAYFEDGHIIRQDMDDTSKTRTDGSGSAFTDVLAYESPLIAFELGRVDDNQIVTVDLRSGAFIVNGTPLVAHNQYFEPLKYKLELVYFRETRIDQNTKQTVQEDGSIKEEKLGSPRHYVNRYFIGWKTEVNGKEKQTTIAVG